MAFESDFKPELRLHPLSWLFALSAYVRQLIVPILAFLFLGARDDGELWGVIFFAPLLIGALWQQWMYRYGFGPRGLVIQDGFLFRNVRMIEYARIENIDVERGVLHRLLGVARVSIATSTGGKPEASIRVLSLEAVQELRERIFQQHHPSAERAQTSSARDEVLLNLGPAELVRFGLIDNRGIIVVAALFGFLAQNGNLFELLATRAGMWLHDSPLSIVAAMGFAMQAALLVSLLMGFILLLRVLSIAIALVTLFDFTLSRHAEDFRIRHGLLTRVALTLRVRRVQAVHQTATLLHRLFSRVSLRVDLAGDSGGGEEKQGQSQTRARWLAPICRPDQAGSLIAAALPDADLDRKPDWQPLAPGARARIFRRSVYLGVLLAVISVVVLHLVPEAPFTPGLEAIGVALALVMGISWLRAHLYVKYTRWALTQDAILFEHGWLTRRLVVAPRNRLQSVKISQSPFDQRSFMANVSLDTAGGSSMRDSIRIPLLPVKVAQQLANALYRSHVVELSRR
ncbi:MAG: PH domain-containing protein [Povalibacter sp.]